MNFLIVMLTLSMICSCSYSVIKEIDNYRKVPKYPTDFFNNWKRNKKQ